MFRRLLTTSRRQRPRDATRREDRRSGPPARRLEPEPMPRMRWHA